MVVIQHSNNGNMPIHIASGRVKYFTVGNSANKHFIKLVTKIEDLIQYLSEHGCDPTLPDLLVICQYTLLVFVVTG